MRLPPGDDVSPMDPALVRDEVEADADVWAAVLAGLGHRGACQELALARDIIIPAAEAKGS